MTKLFYAVNGTYNNESVRRLVEKNYHEAMGTVDKVIEIDKTEIKILQEALGWTQVTVEYRGQFNG